MRIDLGLVLAIAVEYILFLYYADTLFYRKRDKWQCAPIIGIFYGLYFVVCTFGNIVVNMAGYFLINFLGFRLCYHIKNRNAAFQSALLVGLQTSSEWAIIALPYLGIFFEPTSLTPEQSLLLTFGSHGIFLVLIMIVSRLSIKKSISVIPSVLLTLMSLIATFCLLMLTRVTTHSIMFSAFAFMLVIVNIFIFIVNQNMLKKESENAALREQALKDKIDYEEYRLLKERDEELRIFRHDFKAHINALNVLISDDNQAAKEYIASLVQSESLSRFTEYSDNKMLNILLSEKKSQCEKQGIELIIDPISAKLDFIDDKDIVALFSNLINNAIEGCQRSEEKKIFLNISTANETFVVVKMENTADQKPIVVNGGLRTHKDSDKLHGIGMNSIRRVLKNYNGNLDWAYDDVDKIFRTTVIINISVPKEGSD